VSDAASRPPKKLTIRELALGAAPITLVDGRYEGENDSAALVPGSELRGDFDGDGRPDAMALVCYDGGGSGPFLYLAWFPDWRDGKESAATFFLGDRMRVESMSTLADGVSAELRYVCAGEGDALCRPGARGTIRLSLRSGEFVETYRLEEGRAGIGDLAGRTWGLTNYRVGEKSVTLDRAAMDRAGDGEAFSLSFEGGLISGAGSCNRFFGTATDTGPLGLSIDALGSTKMFCVDEPYGLAEFEYLEALGAVEGWELSLGRLRLHGRRSDGGLIELSFRTLSP
jgi:hypothetical protein